ncbi:M24 family metallopeptidase [Streptosporangium lutulentum]|uniref:Xaa-Pro aminopeptidase n=1 Tax=Streptosporangium lutulentum TaxID=1461250 RepID=A0ABT9Q6R4_9ACTN|nr:M24 family metallopeptidase [Streptosporangium lutulentum]MDP9842445.1 Xaa-Pro aminopeptidase [Streptosporangium lutulentum]
MSTPLFRSPLVAPAPFSTGELHSRRALMRAAATAHGADVVLAYGANRTGSAIPWLTTWPVTREALFVLPADGAGHLLVGFHNHVPDARRTVLAADLGDEAGPIGDDPAHAAVRALRRLGPACRVGLVGPVPARVRDAVGGWASAVVTLDEHYTRLRMVKSDEELRWLEHAAALTDLGAAALLDAAGQGASEREMVAAAEHAYRAEGGTHHICYVTTTSMSAPDRCVPAQWPGERVTRPGSVVVFELSAGWGQDHPAQLLRTAVVGAEPPALYRRLHAVAETVRDEVMGRLRAGVPPAELLASLRHVRAEGLSTVDDLLHGLGGGYLPPVLSGRDLTPRGLHAEPLRAGTTLVVQPNVCTPDLSAGVQTGEMVVVTDTGCRSLHRFPPGLLTLPFDASRPYG